ncbi:MAG TPA: cytochrome C oxidase subunit IV family protein [Saprospiraceae bacterium]|nr:cytochrome C oxidase subunit IV family protein [Saprospiraceae bacterium]
MGGHLSYEEGKKVVLKGLILLGIVTLLEVFVALLGKGYIVEGFHLPVWLMYLAMIGMSLYKAYFIVYEFMHMRYEVPGLVKSVLLPTVLLIWAVIAFFYEGSTWRNWRQKAKDRPVTLSNAAPTSEHNPHEASSAMMKDSIHSMPADSTTSHDHEHGHEHNHGEEHH